MSKTIKILRNTAYLYVRLIITVIISLFATRIILENLGVIDYGIYNVVAGVVMLFMFFNEAMTSSTQRHLSIDMSKEGKEPLSVTFNASIRIHVLLAAVVFLFGETIGLTLVKNLLNIPLDRIEAATWVYHCVILIFVVNIISIPYQSIVNAREDMHIIAAQGILESSGRLAAAYLIVLISGDRLKTYGFLLVILTAIVALLFYFYSTRKYPECKFNSQKIDWSIYKELSLFAGWTVFGSVASIVKKQGSIIVLNIFFGPAINAAFGIAAQIGNQIGAFSSTMLKASNPQIVMSYGKSDPQEMFKYLSYASRFSFYLFLIISLPLFLEMEYILGVWLKSVPDFTLIFSKLILINVFIEILIGPFITAIQATGRIKNYQLTSGITFLLNLPVMYLLLYLGLPPESIIWSNIVFTIFVGIIRLYFLFRLVHFPVKEWIKGFLGKGILILVAILCISLPLYLLMDSGFLRLFVTAMMSTISSLIFIFLLGLDSRERGLILDKIRSEVIRMKPRT